MYSAGRECTCISQRMKLRETEQHSHETEMHETDHETELDESKKCLHVYMLLRNYLALCGTIQHTTEQYIALYYRTMRCAKSLVIMSTGMSDKSSICASGVSAVVVVGDSPWDAPVGHRRLTNTSM